jgi:hypothetical protein
VTALQASDILTGLKCTLAELRDAVTDETFIYAKKTAKKKKEADYPYPVCRKMGQKKK